MKKILLVALPFLLIGCANTTPSQVQLDQANYGEYPEFYSQQVDQLMKQGLKDPYSAHINIQTTPVKFWIDQPGFSHMWNDDVTYGYVVTGTINAKNIYGAYVGEKPFTVFFRNNGNVVNVTPWLDSLPHGTVQ